MVYISLKINKFKWLISDKKWKSERQTHSYDICSKIKFSTAKRDKKEKAEEGTQKVVPNFYYEHWTENILFHARCISLKIIQCLIKYLAQDKK